MSAAISTPARAPRRKRAPWPLIKCAVSHWSCRPGRDDRRRPRLLLRVLDRAAPGHPAHDRRLDRRRRSGVRPSQRAAHCAVRQIHGRHPAGSDAQLAESRRSRRDVVSVVTLLLGATTVFNALEAALEQIWGARELVPKGLRGWVRTRILSFGLILAVGFLLLVSLSLSTALAALREAIGRRFTEFVVLAGVLDFVISVGARDWTDRAHLSLHARATPGMASDPVGRARHGTACSISDAGASRGISAARRSPQRSALPRRSRRCCCGCTTPRRSSCSARSSLHASAACAMPSRKRRWTKRR